MPVKQRTSKRCQNPAAEVDLWAAYFNSGFDFFDDLPEIGVETDAYGRPDHAVGEAAWHRLGAWFLAHHKPRQADPWALREFGEPHAG